MILATASHGPLLGPRELFGRDFALDPQGTKDSLLLDPVTHLWNGAYREQFMRQAQEWVQETRGAACYVEMDLRNVGGVNASLGHQATNERYFEWVAKRVAGRFAAARRRGAIEWFELFRHGGDEFSVVVGGADLRTLTALLDGVVRATARHAELSGLDMVPHPKHLFSFRHWGLGVAYGIATIDADRPLREIFSQADRRTERFKRGLAPGRRNPCELSLKKRLKLCGILLGILAKFAVRCLSARPASADDDED